LCAFCATPITPAQPVAYALEQRPRGYDWYSDGVLVASATMQGATWTLRDAAGGPVVTLVHDDAAGAGRVTLVGPDSRRLGSITPHADNSESIGGSVATDPDGRLVMVLRTDGTQAAHVVDRSGDVVAVASWEDADASTDLLVTPHGAGQPLAMVFGLLLALEVKRRSP